MDSADKLFREIRSLPAGERERALRDRCGDDTDLRAAVEALLAFEAPTGDLGQEPAQDAIDMRATGELPDPDATAVRGGPRRSTSDHGDIGRTIGHYTITGVLGEGGMGVVYRAAQDRPQREVALKLIRPELASRQHLRRFEFEAELLGRLRHPGIAQIHEAGIDPASGSPYFAMELIEGELLTAYAARHRLGTRERMRLFAEICRAVHHAHSRGVIHRDLKPSNILVTEVDNPPRPQPKILDFGVARLTDVDTQSATLRTDIGQLIGTVPYMSPEQVIGDPDALDTRSDVYALGVVLYELLVERLPYDINHRLIHEAVRVIREEVPTRLSRFDRALRGDVETIVAKALEKERERRYQSAGDLATDIDRYLTDEPIAARPASTWYQLRKFSQRHKTLVGGVAATFLVLVAGVVGTATFAVRAEDRRVQAERAGQAESDAKLAALDAQQDAVARAEELELVAALQSEQLSGIDAPLMGLRLRADLIEKVRAAAVRSRMEPAAVDARVAEVERLIAGADFTGMALETLEENIFARALDAIDAQLADQPLVRARLLQTVAETTRTLGLFELAEEPQEAALALRLATAGSAERDVLESKGNLALLLRARGELEDSEALQREVFDARRQALGPDDPDTLTAMHNLGVVLLVRGMLEESETILAELLDHRRGQLGDDDPETLNALAEMSSLRRRQGRYADAEELLSLALAGRRRVLGDDHRSTITAIVNMGVILRLRGRLPESEAHYREALAGFSRVFGADHPRTLTALNGVGNVLLAQGKNADAEVFFLESLARRRRLLGDDHRDTITSVSSLGLMLYQQGRMAEAEPYWTETLAGYRRTLGDRHQDTLVAMSNMGTLRQGQGRLAEAEALYRDVLEIRRDVLGEDHPDTLQMIAFMSGILRAQGRLVDAEPYYRAALDGNRRVLGDDHPSTLYTCHNMGVLLQEQDRLAEAEPFYREAAEGRRRALGAEHPNTLFSALALGDLLRLLGDAEAAREILEADEPAARRAWVDQNAKWLGYYLAKLGSAQTEVGAFQRAEASLLEAHALLAAGFGPAHAVTAKCAERIATLYDAWHAAEPGAGHDVSAEEWRVQSEPPGGAPDEEGGG